MDEIITEVSDDNNNTNIIPDNNNNNNKSYSLRPRSGVRPGLGVEDEENFSEWRPRGRTKRRTKQKPPPLSKYRRKTANARERSRMREINEAFESLRRAVPHLSGDTSSNEKMTKITTLRLAMKYIAALTQALQEPDHESDLDSAEYTLSLTPTSISDHSDLYDNFLCSDPPSSSSNLSGFNPLRTSTNSVPTSCFNTLPPPTDNSTTLLDIRDNCLTPTDFHTDFDAFATSSVDFDDFVLFSS